MPSIHDIFTLAYIPDELKFKSLKDKIRIIINYILDHRFQSLPWGYGLVFYHANKRFYGCGWSPKLPCFHDFKDEGDQRTLILYLDLMSHFEEARKSDWFKNGVSHLEQFKTDFGTYCFPKNYLVEMKDQYFVGGTSMGLGENRRKKNALEIESTFRMLLIKKRIEE